MGYHHVDPATVGPSPDRPSVQRAIADHVGLERLAVNRYEAAAGEDIPLAYHAHETQEEVFYVLSGVMHVETPAGTFEVGADEAFVAEPDSPHRAYNHESAADELCVLAVGAPRTSDAYVYEP